MAPGYRIGESAGKGRCLVATRAFPAGAVVLACEPYEAVLRPEEVASRSHATFKSSANLLRCSGCKFARYASREEQVQAWKEGHKEECKALQRCAPDVPNHCVRLVARVLWKRLRGGSSPPEQGGSYSDVKTMLDHWEELEQDRKEYYMVYAAKTLEFMYTTHGMAGLDVREEIARLHARMAFNANTIFSDSGSPIAEGIFPLGAMVNHSCTPNTVQAWAESHTLVLRATQAISAGEEITITYVPLDKTRPERRTSLLLDYMFDINAGLATADMAEPLATLWETAGQLPIEIRVWLQPPWPLDKKDAQLMGLAAGPSAGIHTAGSGVMSAFQSAEGKSGLFQMLEGLGNDMSDWPFDSDLGDSDAANSSKEVGGEAGLRRQRRLVVDCWGPAFLKGEGIWQAEVRQLARHLLGLCIILAPAGDKRQALSFDSDASGPFKLGRLHILRYRLLQIRAIWLNITTGSRPALDTMLAIKDFYALMFPQACPQSAIHEALIADLASNLGMHRFAREVAGRALPQLRMVVPSSVTILEMMRLIREG